MKNSYLSPFINWQILRRIYYRRQNLFLFNAWILASISKNSGTSLKGETLSQYDTNIYFPLLEHKIIFTIKKKIQIVYKYSSRFILPLHGETFLVPSLIWGDKTLLNGYMHCHYMSKWYPGKLSGWKKNRSGKGV